MDSLSNIFQSVKQFILDIPPNKRYLIGGLSVAIISIMVFLLVWAFQPQYRTLFSNLPMDDAGQIMDILRENNIPYKIANEGEKILVPSKRLYNARLKVAAKELPSDHSTGWELFDESNFGVTDFVQKLNYHRGLEGEITRTILQLDPIEAVRVHLNIPDESLFRENQKETMASVTLKLKKNQKLSVNQVEGIAHLVSSAVEGLDPAKVTIVDSKGIILSARIESDPLMKITSSQYGIQKQVEKNLVDKGQKLLDLRFGQGRSSIQVTAKLDFLQKELTLESFDSENPSIRSEEIISSNSSMSDTSSSSNENTITNFELDRTLERTVSPQGTIDRLSIAVIVDGQYQIVQNPESNSEERRFVPLSKEDLQGVENTIKSAMGFNLDRGDDISVVSVPFQELKLIDRQELKENLLDNIVSYGQRLITFVAIILMLLMVRNFLKKSQEAANLARAESERQNALPQLGPGFEESDGLVQINFEDDLPENVKAAKSKNEMIQGFIETNPELAARLVRSWLVEDTSKYRK